MFGRILQIAAETLLVGLAGLLIALGANLVSPRGLSLTRDYFPGASARPLPSASANLAIPAKPGLNSDSATTGESPPAQGADSAEAALARLREAGIRVVEDAEVVRFFQDPRRAQELIVFVDARDERHFREGHIPGAHPFDRYRPEDYLPNLLPVCQTAEQIVVYCTGGNCEDSEFAALALRDAGVPAARLAVYIGGIAAWQTLGQPVESGDRGSGVTRPAGP